jgi:NAD(P)-dependent dehydrogenase (short-subunit alcohol dehydrogenase family)
MSITEELFSLTGKTALVTGGASGIGSMISHTLMRAGANVMIASRKGEECARAAEQLNSTAKAEGLGSKANGFTGDLATEEGIEALVAEVKSRCDQLHILCNNSGISWGAPLDDFPYFAWSKIMDVNVTGMFVLTQQLLPLLSAAAREDDPARVINLGSVMGTAPIGDGAYSYAASKAAVHHLTRILARELAHKHITFNAFAPGPFQTRMTSFATSTDEQAEHVGTKVPLGRIGKPADIAGATLYLCGKGGSYITGAVLPIDGGIHVETGHDLFSDQRQ